MINYARNQGLSLLETIIQNTGPIFTFEQAYQAGHERGISRQNLGNILSKMAASGWIARLKRGLYVIQSPLYEAEIHPFAIAQALVEPIAISHWSALAYHSFTTQIPPMVQASTPTKVVTPEMRSGEAYRPRGTTAWKVLDLEIEYIHVNKDQFWGSTQEWVSNWHRVQITDPERTTFDLIARSDLFGGIAMAIETINLQLDKIDVPQLVNYALRYDVGAYIKRLGWILDITETPDNVLAPLLAYETQNYHLLDPQGRSEGTPITRWKLYNNLPGVADA